MGFKQIPLVDIIILVSGYLIRVLYGSSIIGIPVSNWLYLMVIAISCYLAFGKRRNEIIKNGKKSRKVLELYNKDFLDKNMYMCGLSDTQFISASHINSGGVWFTSIQNLHYRWTMPLVLNDNKYNGNIRLLEMGAISVSMEDLESELSIAQIIAKNEVIKEKEEIYIDQMSIFEFID